MSTPPYLFTRLHLLSSTKVVSNVGNQENEMITAHCRLVSALMFECECKCNQRPCNWIKQLRTIAKRVYAAVAAAAQGDRSLSCANMSLNSAPCCGRVYYDVSKGTSRGKTIRTCICRLRVPRVERAWVLHGIAETGICRCPPATEAETGNFLQAIRGH